MTIPTVTQPGTGPDRVQAPEDYDAQTTAYRIAFNTSVGEFNTAVAAMNALGATVDADATAVETARLQVASNKAAVDVTKDEIDAIKLLIDAQEIAVTTAASGYVTATLIPGTVTGTNCDLSTGNFFEITLDGNKTVTFSNFPTEGEWSVVVTATTTATLGFSDVTDEIGEETLLPPADTFKKFYHFWTKNGGTNVTAGQST